MRRLFLFAGYDKTGKIGSSLLWYLKSLANHGDVIFVADSDINQGELEKLESLTLHNEAAAHGEYDFGSYKRAFGWAKENADLNKYEYIYGQ